MRQADWLTSAAAALGVIGISIGWPEADPVAAGLIALSIFRNAARQLRHVLSDLADSTPTDLDGNPSGFLMTRSLAPRPNMGRGCAGPVLRRGPAAFR